MIPRAVFINSGFRDEDITVENNCISRIFSSLYENYQFLISQFYAIINILLDL